MPNSEINDLTNKATPVSSDEVEIQETTGGTSYKATVGNLAKGMSLDNISAGSTNKHFTSTDETKLDGIATGATANTDNDIIDLIYPVGSIYTEITGTNPGTTFGRGTWTAFGTGRVLVGYDSGDTDFDTAEETGGAKTHTLTEAELPAHNHSVTDGGHSHSTSGFASAGGAGSDNWGSVATTMSQNRAARNTDSSTTGISIGNTGSGSAHNNLQPYIVVHFWKRTA